MSQEQRVMMEVSQEFRFEAMHWLPNVPDGHKCKTPHGHSYVVVVTVYGEVKPELGWVQDYADIRAAVDPLIAQLDHCDGGVNKFIPNSTAENMALWFAAQLKGKLRISSIAVHETHRSCAILRWPLGLAMPGVAS